MFDDLETIYIVFQSFNSKAEKVDYLKKLQSRNLPHNINYERLIQKYS